MLIKSSAKVEEMGNTIMTKASFLSEPKIEQLLRESGFTNIGRFHSTGLFGGWICHAE
ncbi:hypothetical protein [Brevibacillus brevis]|uniref:hypothetical protein n=1 Tax=Brevibacillus brevis TaxID=1393 RepID=UPI0021BD5A9D|nr:hypothetical protein [Brevibacillus brevis]